MSKGRNPVGHFVKGPWSPLLPQIPLLKEVVDFNRSSINFEIKQIIPIYQILQLRIEIVVGSNGLLRIDVPVRDS